MWVKANLSLSTLIACEITCVVETLSLASFNGLSTM